MKKTIPLLLPVLLALGGCVSSGKTTQTEAAQTEETAQTETTQTKQTETTQTKTVRQKKQRQKAPRQKTVQPNKDDPRECARNFTYDGSFMRGRTFKTNASVKGVKKDQAIQRAARYIANDGWQINNTDSNLGIISASQTVSYGNGKTAPLNVGIEPVQGGVKVSLSYSISGGVTSPVDAVQNFFCSVVQTVEGK
ncbi:MAG: hypothetical protein LBF50_03955 [Azoarcus sp.]|jgi:Tfp pilus assembly protein PilP|nr:hypothetical protein [Azoarcus sp.]